MKSLRMSFLAAATLSAFASCSKQTVQDPSLASAPAAAAPGTQSSVPPAQASVPTEQVSAPHPPPSIPSNPSRPARTTRPVPTPPAIPSAPEAIPTGHSTPEGVACDAVKAYIDANGANWLATLVRPIYGENDAEYEAFKSMMVDRAEAHRQDPAYIQPRFVRVCRAREFSTDGPRSAAFATHGFTGNMFVDIYIEVPNSGFQRLRYHVLKDRDERWYFDPRPDLNMLYSSGINEEAQSEEVIWQES